ncbi:MAG: hypothetical protein JSS97_10050 [Actinobacteria bacterium]|nr:hypothetical protein [Actinomycetota bacterium]
MAAAALAIVAIGAALWLLFPRAYLSYDPTYGILWGREITRGLTPDYGAILASTPHPAGDLIGFLTSWLSVPDAISISLVVAYLSLGLTAYLVFRLGALWFDRWIGVVAAVIVLSAEAVLFDGLRAGIDLPFVAICLGALLVETKRPRAGWPVLALLVPAGLLRPDAWFFACAYWLYLAVELGPPRASAEGAGRFGHLMPRPGWRGERSNRELVLLGLLALSAPLIWAGFDLVITGNPLYSFTGTQSSAEALGRERGPVDLILDGPHALASLLQWSAAISALVGVAFGVTLLRSRAARGLLVTALGLIAFAILSSAGMPILSRYLVLDGALLSIFAAVGLLGWRLLPGGHRWRRRWLVLAAFLLALFLVLLPRQWKLDSEAADKLGEQDRIESDLSSLIEGGAYRQACGPIAVPGFPEVPRVALGLGIRPSQVIVAGVPAHGTLLVPADPAIRNLYLTGSTAPVRSSYAAPSGFSLVARNSSWKLYERCAGGGGQQRPSSS